MIIYDNSENIWNILERMGFSWILWAPMDSAGSPPIQWKAMDGEDAFYTVPRWGYQFTGPYVQDVQGLMSQLKFTP